MKRMTPFLLIITFCKCVSQTNTTTFDPLLLYDQSSFDADTCCWRKLSEEKKYLDAANLIIDYLHSNPHTNTHSLNWHAGQMLAMAGSNSMAKKYFRKTYSVFYVWFGDVVAKSWYYYAKGTIAFIDQDKRSMEKIITKWHRKFPPDINLKALETLNNHWDKDYAEASRQ